MSVSSLFLVREREKEGKKKRGHKTLPARAHRPLLPKKKKASKDLRALVR
jgi:hypothetical protein